MQNDRHLTLCPDANTYRVTFGSVDHMGQIQDPTRQQIVALLKQALCDVFGSINLIYDKHKRDILASDVTWEPVSFYV